MRIESCYPVLMLDDVAGAGDFFARHFGFAVAFASDWYVSLRHPAPPHPEIAFLDATHATIPAGYGATARGVLVNLEVPDAAAAWARLQSAAPVALPLRDEPFGQRHFILVGPSGVLVDVIQNIPPAPAFAAQFSDAASPGHTPAPAAGHDA